MKLITFFALAALAFAQPRPLDNIASRQYQHEIRPLRLALDRWLHELGLQDAGLSIRLVKASDLAPNSCGIAEKCFDGIQALRHYRYEVDEDKSDPSGKRVNLSKVPLHDWASHPADAFRTAAVMIKEPEKKKEQEKRRPPGKLSPWS